MKKVLFFLFFLFVFSEGFSQLDTQHWFAPIADRTGNARRYPTYQTLYLSTNDTTPFKVKIYNNNMVIDSLMISKNNPGKYHVNRHHMIVEDVYDLFKPVNKGLYLQGERPFFATFRFSVFNHAEIITSKGTAGVGKSFRAVMAPIIAFNPILNFTTGIMATENNTQITVSEYSPYITFADRIVRAQINITLNKGQSYIIEGNGAIASNQTGFIGANIQADKPIVISNGNFNGQYATTADNSSDILMDQSVPIDKLGQEFILIKGNGTNTSGIEKAIIVATEDNTAIYLNGALTPSQIINKGKYYMTAHSDYTNQGFGHYNMYIKTSKNAYVYQLLAGTDDIVSSVATGGFNYIPPLSCYLPKKIDEIGLIQENYVQNNANPSGMLNIPTKLNIITEKGATVDIKSNGTSLTLTSNNGPFPVPGSSNWVTYSYPNITGNIAIFSTRSVTAGISAGNDAVGYGGFFAGFSSIPIIVKREGECLPDVKLEATEGFDSYRWLIKVGSVYTPAPGINNQSIYQPSQAGTYAVELKQGSCATVKTTDFNFYNCLTYTNDNYDTCSTKIVTPKFALSTQAINITSLKIDTPPSKGTVAINPNGTLSYTANSNALGTDKFKYLFCGIGAVPDCEIAQATINLNQIVTKIDTLKVCSVNSIATYNLTLSQVTPNLNVTKTYYKTKLGAENEIASDVIDNFTAYTTPETSVFARIKNSFACKGVSEIVLRRIIPPDVQPTLFTRPFCDEELDAIIDGVYKADLNKITPVIVLNITGNSFIVKYYDNQQKAITGGADNIMGIFNFKSDTTVWVRVESPNCPPIIKPVDLKTANTIKLLTRESTQFVCDTNIDDTESVNVSNYIKLFTSSTSSSYKMYLTLDAAKSGIGAFSNNQNIPNGITTFYFRISDAGGCDDIAILHLNLIKGNLSTLIKDEYKICKTATTTIDAGTGFENGHVWYSTSAPTSPLGNNQNITLGIGKYFVILTSPNLCTNKQFFEIKEVELPTITKVSIDNNTVTVEATGGNAPYTFAIDNDNYQASNIFYNVTHGLHILKVKSLDNCDPITMEFYVIKSQNSITPNHDGINDVIDYSALKTKTDARLQIIDRYGKKVFDSTEKKSFIWDGTYNGSVLPTASYWYILDWKEYGVMTPIQKTGWILLKNR